MSMRNDLSIERPEATATRQLLRLFHGVGSSAEDLRPLGEALAAYRSGACVVSVRSPDPSDLGQGWQWFSVRGVTEADRPARVAAAMPRFVEAVRAWQRETGVGAGSTTLIGFSQGAIMALESTQLGSTHFLTRTLHRVRTEMSLQVLAYNLRRAIKILGATRLMAEMKA